MSTETPKTKLIDSETIHVESLNSEPAELPNGRRQEIRDYLREDFLEIIQDKYRRIPETVNMLSVITEIGSLLTSDKYDPTWDINFNSNESLEPSSPAIFQLRTVGEPITFYQCRIDNKFGTLEAYPCGQILRKEPVVQPHILGITLRSKMGTQDNFVHIVLQREGFFLVNPSAISRWYPIRFSDERNSSDWAEPKD